MTVIPGCGCQSVAVMSVFSIFRRAAARAERLRMKSKMPRSP